MAAPLVSSTRPLSVAAEMDCCAIAGSVLPGLTASSTVTASKCFARLDCMVSPQSHQKGFDQEALLVLPDDVTPRRGLRWPQADDAGLRVLGNYSALESFQRIE